MRLGLVTEGMIHRPIDDLMDWLDANTPDVRLLEVGTGGYSPLGHSPLDSSAGRIKGVGTSTSCSVASTSVRSTFRGIR